MPRQIKIITPENIPLTMEPAGLATRFGALLIDLFLQSCVAVILLFLLGLLSLAGVSLDFMSGSPGKGSMFGYVALAVLVLIALSFFSGYFIFFELLWNGQTPGKRTFNLRVIREGGYPIDLGATATRNLIRIVDFLPISYAIGALTMFFNPNYKRLGDLVAGTIVIKEHPGVNLPTFKTKGAPIGPTYEPFQLPEGTLNAYDVLSADELGILRQFAVRRWQMTSDDSERLAYRLVAPLVPQLNITFKAGVAPRYADVASAIVVAADKREEELIG